VSNIQEGALRVDGIEPEALGGLGTPRHGARDLQVIGAITGKGRILRVWWRREMREIARNGLRYNDGIVAVVGLQSGDSHALWRRKMVTDGRKRKYLFLVFYREKSGGHTRDRTRGL
jgi:hypothetical protein